MTNQALARLLTAQPWRFARAGGEIIAPALMLSPSGRILCGRHPNESRWRLGAEGLEFLNQWGEATTRFGMPQADADGRPRFEGPFLAEPALAARHVLTPAPGHVATAPARTAVLIRTHVVNDTLWSLIDALHGSPAYDLYVLADETRAPLPFSGLPVIRHSVPMCAELGLATDFAPALWWCGDYPLFCAMAQQPDYDHYVQIEFDVHLVRQNPLFLEAVIARLRADPMVDLAVPYLAPAPDGWQWTAAAQAAYPAVWRSFFPFVALSRRAALHLLAERRREASRKPAGEAPIHCEAFCGTALQAAGGFNCLALEELLPGCIDWQHFGTGHERFFLLGQPVATEPRIEMLHPICDPVDYLGRRLHRARQAAEVPGFIADLGQFPPEIVPENVTRYYREQAEAFLAGR